MVGVYLPVYPGVYASLGVYIPVHPGIYASLVGVSLYTPWVYPPYVHVLDRSCCAGFYTFNQKPEKERPLRRGRGSFSS